MFYLVIGIIMMKISKYGNYDKTSFDLSNVECIIGHNTRDFARFEKRKASLYESLILRVISNYFTALLDMEGEGGRVVSNSIFILVISSVTRANWHTSNFIFVDSYCEAVEKLNYMLQASFASFFLARYLNAMSTDLYLPS